MLNTIRRMPWLTTALMLVLPGLPAVHAQEPDELLFKDGFEALIGTIPTADLLMTPHPTEDAICGEPGSTTISVRPGTEVTLCYTIQNLGEITLEHHRIVDTTFGVTVDVNLDLPPGESITLIDAGSPRLIEERSISLVTYTATTGSLSGTRTREMRINVAPALELFRLLTTDPSECTPGLAPFFPSPLVSGYRLLTVAPGTPVTHCFRAVNASIGIFAGLGDHLLTDSLFGVVYDNPMPAMANFEVFTVAETEPAGPTSAFSAQWQASDGVQTVTGEGQSALILRQDPACEGIEEHTTYDYIVWFPGGTLYMRSGFRLDYQVNAVPAIGGQPMAIEANGFIASLTPDETFGPRDDTRIILPIPEGIDTSQPITASGTLTGGQALTASVDLDEGLIILSTGPVPGPPAGLDVYLTVTPDGSVDPIRFTAPTLELDIISTNGEVSTSVIDPDFNGPPILTTPLCLARTSPAH